MAFRIFGSPMTASTLYPEGLTIVLPCFKPPKGWADTVECSVSELELATKENIHLIIVNDGTGEEVDRELKYLQEKIPRLLVVSYSENRGKGYALRQGVKEAKTAKIIFTDIDFPYVQGSLISVYDALKEDVDVALGHRGKAYYSKTPFIRKVISKSLRWVLKTFLRLPTDDSQCGIKGFNQKGAAVFLDTRIDRFLFDLEFIKLAAKRKLKIVKVEVELKPNVIFSKVNFKILLRESINFFRVLFRK